MSVSFDIMLKKCEQVVEALVSLNALFYLIPFFFAFRFSKHFRLVAPCFDKNNGETGDFWSVRLGKTDREAFIYRGFIVFLIFYEKYLVNIYFFYIFVTWFFHNSIRFKVNMFGGMSR